MTLSHERHDLGAAWRSEPAHRRAAFDGGWTQATAEPLDLWCREPRGCGLREVANASSLEFVRLLLSHSLFPSPIGPKPIGDAPACSRAHPRQARPLFTPCSSILTPRPRPMGSDDRTDEGSPGAFIRRSSGTRIRCRNGFDRGRQTLAGGRTRPGAPRRLSPGQGQGDGGLKIGSFQSRACPILPEPSFPFLPRYAQSISGTRLPARHSSDRGAGAFRANPQAGASPRHSAVQAAPPLPSPKGLGQSDRSTCHWQIAQTVLWHPDLTEQRFSQSRTCSRGAA